MAVGDRLLVGSSRAGSSVPTPGPRSATWRWCRWTSTTALRPRGRTDGRRLAGSFCGPRRWAPKRPPLGPSPRTASCSTVSGMADEDVMTSRPEAQVCDGASGSPRLAAAAGVSRGRDRAPARRRPVRGSGSSSSAASPTRRAGRRDGVPFHAEPPAPDGVVVDPGRRPGRRPGRSPTLLSPRGLVAVRASVSPARG
jgi:hypothetical protein